MAEEPHQYFTFQEVVPDSAKGPRGRPTGSAGQRSMEPRASSSGTKSKTPAAAPTKKDGDIPSTKLTTKSTGEDITVQYIKENDFPQLKGKKNNQRPPRIPPVDGVGYYKGSKHVPGFMQASGVIKEYQPAKGGLRSTPQFKNAKSKAATKMKKSTTAPTTKNDESHTTASKSAPPSKTTLPTGSGEARPKPTTRKPGRPRKSEQLPKKENDKNTKLLSGIDALTSQIVKNSSKSEDNVSELLPKDSPDGATGVSARSHSQGGSTRGSDLEHVELNRTLSPEKGFNASSFVTSTPVSTGGLRHRKTRKKSLEKTVGENSLIDTSGDPSLIQEKVEPKPRGRPPKKTRGRRRKIIPREAVRESSFSDSTRDQSLLDKTADRSTRSSRAARRRKSQDADITQETTRDSSVIDGAGSQSVNEEISLTAETQEKEEGAETKENENEESKLDDSSTAPKKRKGRQPKKGGVEQSFSCGHCEKVCETKLAIMKHYMEYHQRFWSTKNLEGTVPPKAKLLRRLGYLMCAKCGKKIQHVSYFNHHLLWCGKEEETTKCEHCGSCVKSMWFKLHKCEKVRQLQEEEKRKKRRQKLGKDADDEEEDEDGEKDTEESEEEEKNEESFGRRSTRKAARKARRSLRHLADDMVKSHKEVPEAEDDDFNDPDVEMKSGSSSSEAASSGETEGSDSASADEVSDLSDYERPVKRVYQKKAPGEIRPRYLSKEYYQKYRDRIVRPETILEKLDVFHNWTEKWHRKAAREGLYEDWRPRRSHWLQLDPREAEQYLPLSKESPRFTIKNSQGKDVLSQGRLELFESFVQENATFNVGGPVWSMAWLPLPLAAEADQYLALYCHRDADADHGVHERSTESALLQLWNCGRLDKKAPAPCMSLGVVLKSGPIWALRWCPTGTWDPPHSKTQDGRLPRLGLLALACGDGQVHIISIPHPKGINSIDSGSDGDAGKSSGTPAIFKVPDTVVLKSCFGGAEGSPLLSLDWHWRGDCTLLAAGTSQGSVVVWDLCAHNPLLYCLAPSGVPELLPYVSFQAHQREVTGVAFYCGSDFSLASCSQDRYLKYWDLRNTQAPQSIHQRSVHTGLIWPLQWPLVFVSNDDCYALGHNAAYAVDNGYYGMYTCPINVHNSCVWDLSCCDWANTLVSCDSVGDVMGIILPVMQVVYKHKTLTLRRFRILRTDLEPLSSQDLDDRSKESNVSTADCQESWTHENSSLLTCSQCGTKVSSPSTNHRPGQNERTSDLVQSEETTTCSKCAKVPNGKSSGKPNEKTANGVAHLEDSVLKSSTSQHDRSQTSQEEQNQTITSDERKEERLDEDLSKKEFAEKYALVYTHSDVKLDKVLTKDADLAFAKFLTPDAPNHCPFRALHKVGFNMNLGSHSWVATGGQAGLVHLMRINAMEIDRTAQLLKKKS